MTIGLPVSSIIAVSVVLTPLPAQFLNFNTLLILGDSSVIDVHQRLRTYSGSTALSSIATDFGTSAPEYIAASFYFSQNPKPTSLFIGRWAAAATAGLNLGGVQTAAQQAIASWTPITNGGFHITVDGGASTNVTGINLSAQTNLNGVASQIQTALQALGGAFAAVTCTWNATYGQFQINSGTTGVASAVSALTAPTAGQDLSAQLLMTAATLSYLQAGVVAESPVASVTLFDTQVATQWYGLMFAATAAITDNQRVANAAYIEGAGNPHLYGINTSNASALVQPDVTSIGALLKAAGYNRSFVQWSNTPHAVASMFGLGVGVNFAGSNTTITWMFKPEPGVVAEVLNTTQQAALNANNYNYYAAMNNNTNIIINGTVASGQFIDTIWGIDWLAGQVQTNCYNVLVTTPKVPQTDAGMNELTTAISSACDQGVANALLAPGIWTAAGFGQLKTGQQLSKGYYVFAPLVSTQSPADRAARKSVPFQVAAKQAGAVHSANILINVNP